MSVIQSQISLKWREHIFAINQNAIPVTMAFMLLKIGQRSRSKPMVGAQLLKPIKIDRRQWQLTRYRWLVHLYC